MIRGPSPRAFTLIEMIATMVLLSILSAFAATIMVNASDGYFDASVTAELHTELSVSLDRVVRELRRIDPDPAASGIAPHIDTVTSDSIVWRDGDDDVYRLALIGSTLILAVDGGPDRVLLTDVSAFAVRTYDENDAALAASLSGSGCDAIRRVATTISLTRFGVTETLGTRIFIRSTMEGV